MSITFCRPRPRCNRNHNSPAWTWVRLSGSPVSTPAVFSRNVLSAFLRAIANICFTLFMGGRPAANVRRNFAARAASTPCLLIRSFFPYYQTSQPYCIHTSVPSLSMATPCGRNLPITALFPLPLHPHWLPICDYP